MNHSIKYLLFSLSDNGQGKYLGTINQTLRVVDVATGEERHINALQYLVDQHPARLLIMPDGEHKKSKATTLAKIAPNRVLSCRRNNTQKRPKHTYLPATRFLKNSTLKNNRLQTSKMPFSQYSRPR